MENAEKRPIYDIYNCSKFHFSDFFSIKQYFALKGQVKEEPNDFNIQFSIKLYSCMPGHKLVWLYLHNEYVLCRIT